MVIVKGSFPVRPRLKAEALALVQALAAAARAHAGCLGCEVYWQANAPATLMLWQQWSHSAQMKSHFASHAMELFLDQLVDLLDGDVDTLYFDVENSAEAHSQGVLPGSYSLAEDVVLH